MVDKLKPPVVNTHPSLKYSASVTLDDVKAHVKLLKAAGDKSGLAEVLKNQKDMEMLTKAWTAAVPAAALDAAVSAASGAPLGNPPKTRADLPQYAGAVLDGPPTYDDLSRFMADKPHARLSYTLPSGEIKELLLRNVAYDAKSGTTRGPQTGVPLLVSEDGKKFEPLMSGGADGKGNLVRPLSDWDREADAMRTSRANPVAGSVTISVGPKPDHAASIATRPSPVLIPSLLYTNPAYQYEYVPNYDELFLLMEQRNLAKANILFKDTGKNPPVHGSCLLQRALTESKSNPVADNTITLWPSETDTSYSVDLNPENCNTELLKRMYL